MQYKTVDTARTTNLPVMDEADAIILWEEALNKNNGERLDAEADEKASVTTTARPPPPPIKANERISVYWTEMNEWYTGTFTSSRVEVGDDGELQRVSRVVYDAVGPWKATTVYWHCLDDERWQAVKET